MPKDGILQVAETVPNLEDSASQRCGISRASEPRLHFATMTKRIAPIEEQRSERFGNRPLQVLPGFASLPARGSQRCPVSISHC